MAALLLNSQTLSDAEAAEHVAANYPDATTVTQPWNSHGNVVQVGLDTYFYGNANDPDDMCGNDPLVMRVKKLTMAGTCPADGLVSYRLFPD